MKSDVKTLRARSAALCLRSGAARGRTDVPKTVAVEAIAALRKNGPRTLLVAASVASDRPRLETRRL